MYIQYIFAVYIDSGPKSLLFDVGRVDMKELAPQFCGVSVSNSCFFCRIKVEMV